jgi:hypothetical protein
MSLSQRSARLSLKDTDRSCSLFLGRGGIIPSPAGGRVDSVVSRMKPSGGYNVSEVPGVASC